MKKIALGCDHAGYLMKEEIKNFLLNNGLEVVDKGTYSEDSVDYPDFAHAVAESVLSKDCEFGILLCGSGNGINMSANKHKGIRAALCWTKEIAELARLHNNANILSLPARFISLSDAFEIVDVFLKTEFEGGRHANRVKKIPC